MYVTLRGKLDTALKNDSVKAVLMYGAQGNFSSGRDVSTFLNGEPVKGDFME